MIHPLLRLVATHPHLLADHAQAYGELIGDEIGKTAASWKQRAALTGVAIGLLVFGLGFAGTALLLWAAIPLSAMPMPWLLVAVPAVPLLLGVVFLVYAQRKPESGFKDLKQQLAADLSLLREATAP